MNRKNINGLIAGMILMKAYHIKHWDGVYETAATRQVRTLTYYSKPNKLVGECLGHMLNQPDGLALYGTWTFLEILASTAPQEHRGWLIRNGSPMDAVRMSALTHIPVKDIQRTLEFCMTAPMDWLELIEWPGDKQGALPLRHQSPDGPPSARHQSPDGNSIRGKKDKETEEGSQREREKKSESSDPKELRSQQQTQFAALSARLRKLEATPEDERTDGEAEEIKKTRRLLNSIQKKQANGDFTPVQEKARPGN